jgi:citrate synthase
MDEKSVVSSGLAGVVAAETSLSMVDGAAGELVIAGFQLAELARNATFEETAWLLWRGDLPTAEELNGFRSSLVARRRLPQSTVDLLRAAFLRRLDPMDVLLMAAPTLRLSGEPEAMDVPSDIRAADWRDALVLLAALPTVVAAYARIAAGREPIPPRDDLGQAENFLYMLRGRAPGEVETGALETYLNTVVDHGLNASTFTARVIVSTDSDLVSAITGALGALKGPLHGGAPGPALDMVFAIGSARNAEPYLRARIEAGERLMGFGHRIYKVRDPRAEVLAGAATTLYREGGDMALYELATVVETTAVRLLEEYKPGRGLATNVEFYTALLLHGLGLDTALFTPIFAISRVAGWIGHAFEQRRAKRIIRPLSLYVGRRDRRWIDLDERGSGRPLQ